MRGQVNSTSPGLPEPKSLPVHAGHADAALAASIFHFNQFSVGQVKQFLARHDVPVRLI